MTVSSEHIKFPSSKLDLMPMKLEDPMRDNVAILSGPDRSKKKIKVISEIVSSGYKRSIPTIIDLLRRETNPKVILAAIDALKKFKDKKAISALVAKLNHKDNDIKIHAADALGAILGANEGRFRTAITALTYLLDSSDESVRITGVHALEDSLSPACLNYLRYAAENDKSDAVRASARRAIKLITDFNKKAKPKKVEPKPAKIPKRYPRF